MSSDTIDPSKKRFAVFIHEVRQEIAFAEEFSGRYTKRVTMSDGTTRTVELTPMMRDGVPVIELNDTGGRTYMGALRAGTATTINGNLMVQVIDIDDLNAPAAGLRSHLPVSSVLPPDSELIFIPEFVPAGFAQGIEILNDNTTPMQFVTDVLTAHAGLRPEESQQAMLAIHARGGGQVPTASFDDARRIAAQITAEAAKQGYPLICRPVSLTL